eukprot:9709005-Alexandrium_andersonii.AAC.1
MWKLSTSGTARRGINPSTSRGSGIPGAWPGNNSLGQPARAALQGRGGRPPRTQERQADGR